MIWWFLPGYIAGLITAAIVSGAVDRITEWRKRRHEQKSVRDHYHHRGGGNPA